MRSKTWRPPIPGSQIKRVSDGLDPINVIRDAGANQKIPTNAWNTILSLAEAPLHQGEEV